MTKRRGSQLVLTLAWVWLGATTACSDKSSSTKDEARAGSDQGGVAGATSGASGEAGEAGSAGAAAGAIEPYEPIACKNPSGVVGSIARPNPLISVGLPVFASESLTNPEQLVDGIYHGSKIPTAQAEDLPVSIAIQVGNGPTNLLLTWSDAGWTPFDNLTGGSPSAYQIEVSGDSTDGQDGTWQVVAEVTENPIRARGHRFDFTDQSWVRMVVTAVPADATRVRLDEVALYDTSQVDPGELPDDTWLFMGDSITQAAFQRSLGPKNFEQLIHGAQPDFYPAMINAGIGGDKVADGVGDVNTWLALNPDFRYVTLAYGTNDAWGNNTPEKTNFEEKLVELVERVEAAGRIPIIPQIPFATVAKRTMPDYNQIIVEVTERYELPCGPDLYAHFYDHRDELNPDDGVHPNEKGNVSLNAAWAEQMAPLYAAD